MNPDRKPIDAELAPTDVEGAERRTSVREMSDLEVLVAWAHAPRTPVRYRAIDVSAGGMRIRSMLPIAQGLHGSVLSTMPHGALPNRSFQTMWCRKVTGDDGTCMAYEAGLRFETQ